MNPRKPYFHRRRPPPFVDGPPQRPGRQVGAAPGAGDAPVAGRPAERTPGVLPPRTSPVRRQRDAPDRRGRGYPAGSPPPASPSETRHAWTADVSRQEWAFLAVVALVALILRLREPLSSAIIGAEDPYLHMERTWSFLRGDSVSDYPLGWIVLLTPLTLLGETGFYYAVRFLPPFLGVVGVVGVFLLCRRFIGGYGALTAAAVVAVMPEHIVRTNLLFPTAVDLAILPFFLLKALELADGDRRAGWWLIGMGAFLILIHPWVVGLAVVPLAVFVAISVLLRARTPGWAAGAMAGGVLAVFIVLHFLPVWRPSVLLFGHALPRLAQLAADPSTITPLPPHINYPHMLTVPVIVLALAGFVVGAVRRDRFSVLAITWVVVLFPVTLVDWFGVWYIPHRAVVFLALGVAMLCGLAVDEGMKRLRTVAARQTRLHRPAGVVAVALVLLLTVPMAAAMPPWYRLYTDDDYDAWATIAGRDPSVVVTGSWQGRAGYGGITGKPAVYNPSFFNDENTRNNLARWNPDLVVLIEKHGRDNGVTTDPFEGWEKVGQWGNVEAYSPP